MKSVGAWARSPPAIRLSVTLAGEEYPGVSAGDCRGMWGSPTRSCRASEVPADRGAAERLVWGAAHPVSGPGKRHLSIFRWNGRSGFAFLAVLRTFFPPNHPPPSVQLGEAAHLRQCAGSGPPRSLFFCLPPICSFLLQRPRLPSVQRQDAASAHAVPRQGCHLFRCLPQPNLARESREAGAGKEPAGISQQQQTKSNL